MRPATQPREMPSQRMCYSPCCFPRGCVEAFVIQARYAKRRGWWCVRAAGEHSWKENRTQPAGVLSRGAQQRCGQVFRVLAATRRGRGRHATQQCCGV